MGRTEPQPVPIPMPRSGAAPGTPVALPCRPRKPPPPWPLLCPDILCGIQLCPKAAWKSKARWGFLSPFLTGVSAGWAIPLTLVQLDSQSQQVHKHVFYCWYAHVRTHRNIYQQKSGPKLTRTSDYWDLGFQMTLIALEHPTLPRWYPSWYIKVLSLIFEGWHLLLNKQLLWLMFISLMSIFCKMTTTS